MPDYKVGYKKPPEHTRFRKGQSGNKHGRPKEEEKYFHHHLEKILERKVKIMRNGKSCQITMEEMISEIILNKAAKGDRKCMDIVLKVVDQREKKKAEKPFSAVTEDDREMVNRHIFKRAAMLMKQHGMTFTPSFLEHAKRKNVDLSSDFTMD